MAQGIRDYKVTGVQTCALPISAPQRDLRLAEGPPPVGTAMLLSLDAAASAARDTWRSQAMAAGEPPQLLVVSSRVVPLLTITVRTARSEERRVGTGGRWRRAYEITR